MFKNTKWLPVIINTIAASISLLFYTFTHLENINSLIIIQIVVGASIPFLLILLTDLLKIKFPTIFNMFIVGLVVFAIYLGNGFSIYSLIPFYDKFLHTYFGYICALIILCVLIYYNGDKLSTPLLLFVVFFFTLGLGGLWEMFEYLCDIVTDGDSLGINKSIENGFHPCTDIMVDLLVTGLGIFLFYLTLLVDKFNGFTLCHKLQEKIEAEKL